MSGQAVSVRSVDEVALTNGVGGRGRRDPHDPQSETEPLVEEPPAPSSNAQIDTMEGQEVRRITWLCFDLTSYSPALQFSFLAAGVFVFFMLCSYIEEYLFKALPEFEFGWYMTVFELVCFAGFAVAESMVKGQPVFAHRAPLSQHMLVAVAMTASRGLTNVSLQYLNYPTQVVFKSMKLITVMLGSVLWLRKTYPAYEYLNAVMLVASACLFSLGDIDTKPEYSTFGLVVVLVSLVADSAHSNTQDRIMSAYNAPTSEVMTWSNAFSALTTLVVCVLVGEIGPALKFCNEFPQAYAMFIARAGVIYLGVLCFVSLIKHFGAVKATTVTTVRKILTIIVSFLLFPKPWTNKYLIGLILFGGSLGVTLWNSSRAPKSQRTK